MKRLTDLRERLGDVVQAPFEVSQLPGVQYTDPPGDPGLFGPGSVTWKVGSDWPSALVGGMSGLILGTLHPQVLAGTLDYSIFRTDPIGRLARTASFVMATGFASTPVAHGVIDHVNRLHKHIQGTTPTGKAYRADDPDLAVWTHTTIYGGFLDGHLLYAPRPIGGSDIDRYWAETARIPTMLGARGVPTSRSEVREYFRQVRPQLEAGRDALDSARWVLDGGKGNTPTVVDSGRALTERWQQLMPGHGLRERACAYRERERRILLFASLGAVKFAYWIFAKTATDLLPEWSGRMLQLDRSPVAEPMARAYFGALRLAVPTMPRALRLSINRSQRAPISDNSATDAVDGAEFRTAARPTGGLDS
ncbi:MAG: oxygenase MpaB family protein [Actinomycetota bacterium]